jgi:excisionase family DNA binding protein
MSEELVAMKLSEMSEKIEQIRDAVLTDKKLFLDVKDAAKYLGISIATIYSYIHYNTLPYFKPSGGRKVYFSIDDLNNFVLNKENRSKSTKEIESEVNTRLMAEKTHSKSVAL